MNIRPADLLEQMGSRDAPAIVDVRSRGEYLAGHVPGAVHIPFWTVGWRAPEVRSAADSPVVVYCLYGPRAWMGGALLRLRGFQKVIYLKGHWAKWRRDGLREEAGDRPA
jgi:rhodanese-related sulfurtransferase